MIIGLCGYARAGKDTVAKFLVQKGFTQLAFADPLRAMALAVDPMISLAGATHEAVMAVRKHPEAFSVQPPTTVTMYNISARYSVILEVLGYEEAKAIPDFRRFLQRLGTEGARGCLWDSIWIDAFARRANALIRDGKHIVISDVRFPNEAAWVNEHGYLWRIDRPGCVRGAHASEAHVDDFAVDYVHVNDGTIDELLAHIDFILLRPLDRRRIPS